MKYSKKDQIEGDLDIKDAKIKVSMFLDGDLLLAIKGTAESSNQKYQTLINQTLREIFLDDRKRIDPNDYQELKQRVDLLEKAFLKIA